MQHTNMHKTITTYKHAFIKQLRPVRFILLGLPFLCIFVTIYVILRQNFVQITALTVASPLIAVLIY